MRRFALLMAASAVAGLSSFASAATVWVAKDGFVNSPILVPPGSAEVFQGFSGFIYDVGGRVLSNAEVTVRDPLTSDPLVRIEMRLWANTDADLFKIAIEDPASFSAYINGTTQVLALFSEDGTAIAASRGGGTANAITGTAFGLTPGQYYIGVAQSRTVSGQLQIGVPRNNANEALFDFATNGVKSPVAGLSDYKLSTDPFKAWTVNNGAALIGTSNFTSGTNAFIRFTGAEFSVVPEPSMALLAPLAAGLVAMRRRRA